MPNKLSTIAIVRGVPEWGDWLRQHAARRGLSILDTIDQALRRDARLDDLPLPPVARTPKKTRKNPRKWVDLA